MTISTQRFSDKVQEYILYRPHYPQVMFDFLLQEKLISPSSVVADIGSGTGISCEGFLKIGIKVFAVEPNDPMREAAERMFEPQSKLVSINGTAENTKLGNCSVDVIFAGQAFHWFDKPKCKIEFSRILKPGGHVLLAWNDRKNGVPFLDAYEALLQQHGTDYNEVNHRNTEAAGFENFFSAGSFKKTMFDNPSDFDYRGLEGRLLSCSYIPERNAPEFQPMMDDLKKIFDKYQVNGTVPFGYDTRLYYGLLD